ncbi:MAG: MarR family transcriptional regulator [Dokdonella sp.]|uniref:MarR family winged helix-turn-helix transcriptional regulator n=1 Tax=Dokdonella sp. TaxID=2291710 RepID=UPI0025C02599|nr:MarR family transcriptional regulator [Dokdonella sp.]MBZ0223061.1 MarR family transcriptional regulator [Dokdonella sp.]MCC7254442.1 MarR family transcriptional regulator [Dokdonella sp.]
MPKPPALDFDAFLPYRLSVLANTVSQDISSEYEERFGLSVTQWRVMAILGRHPDLTARDVARRTAMDKVAVSRAVAGLEQRELLARTISRHDRREAHLRLTRSGRSIHDQIVPLALKHERRLLERLTAEEQRWLAQVLDRLQPSASLSEA